MWLVLYEVARSVCYVVITSYFLVKDRLGCIETQQLAAHVHVTEVFCIFLILVLEEVQNTKGSR